VTIDKFIQALQEAKAKLPDGGKALVILMDQCIVAGVLIEDGVARIHDQFTHEDPDGKEIYLSDVLSGKATLPA